MTLLDATAHSVNTIFAQVVTAVKPSNVVITAPDMGITSRLQAVCSITLGSQGVTPLEMANAYATLAASGVRHSAQAVQEVKSPDGAPLDKPSFKGAQAIGANDANLTTYALQGVIQHGTGTAANIGRPAAGKTGTAQNYVDAWFCGYVPQLAACVWMGYPKNETTPMQNVEGFPTVFGGSLPAEIWHDFMAAAVEKMPVKDFPAPSFSGYDKNPKGTVSPTPSPSPSASSTPTSPTPLPSLPTPSLPPTTPPSPSPSASPSATAAPTSTRASPG